MGSSRGRTTIGDAQWWNMVKRNASLSAKLSIGSPLRRTQKVVPGVGRAGGYLERGLEGAPPVRVTTERNVPPVGPQGNLGAVPAMRWNPRENNGGELPGPSTAATT